ncbi:MCE family protein [Actinocorallia longicatena]|uniref:MCE family protein n=1 Tax=Actinocorallia longicatena TaxID=111803 RepID=A0ABP6QLV7_9ACTN
MKKILIPLATALAVGLTGCSAVPSIQEVTLPGGADVGDHPYTVDAEFANVLNLTPQTSVKVNDVAVGRVTKVTLPRNGWTARVTLLVNGAVKLPANATAKLEQSSLLGEKFIQLAAPLQPSGSLADGATIPIENTNRDTEIEEVFGALSLLLNGGGLTQLRTITRELNAAFKGNEPQIKQMLKRVTTLVSQLDGNKKAITEALDGLNRLTATLNARKTEINTVLDDLGPGLGVLEEQRHELVGMLESLDKLSAVATRTVKQSKKDFLADLKALEPTLRRLAQAGKDLPNALQVLFTYPFTDAVLPAIKGDYLNGYLNVIAPPGTEVVPPVSPQTPATPAPTTPAPTTSPTTAVQ